MLSKRNFYGPVLKSAAALAVTLMASGCSPSPDQNENTAATAVASASMVLEDWLQQAVPTEYALETVRAMRASFDEAVDQLAEQSPQASSRKEQTAAVRDALHGAVTGLKNSDKGAVRRAAHILSASEFTRPRSDRP
jgi:cytochrome c556